MDINANQFWSSKLKVESTMDLEDGIEQTTINNANRNDTATTFNGVTTGSSAPSGTKAVTAGEHWHRTGALTGAPSERDLVYNSAAGDWVSPTDSVFQATAPSWTQTGLKWYDTTAFIDRRYKGASFDISGLAGWHSAQDGYELWKNLTGAAATPGMVVTTDATVSYREFIAPQAVKDGNVVGVVAETISSTSNGLIATVAGGCTVNINVSTETHAVAIGDGLVCNGAGDTDARSVGSIDNKNPNATAGVQYSGTPYGCFAQAMEAVALGTSGAPIKARLLGAVGQGRSVTFGLLDLMAHGDASFTFAMFGDNAFGSWFEVDVEDPPSGTSIFDGTSVKHSPILGVDLRVLITQDETQNVDEPKHRLQFSSNQSAVHLDHYHYEGDVNSSSVNIGHSQNGRVPTAASGAYTTLGNVFSWRGYFDKGTGVAIGTETAVSAIGYIY